MRAKNHMRLAYYKLYWGDYRKATLLMDFEQQGLYVHFVGIALDEDEPGSLPDDDAALASMAKVSKARWRTLKPIVLKAWTRKGTRLVNASLRHQHDQDRAKLKQLSDAAIKANRVRWSRETGASASSDRTPTGLRSESPPSPSPAPASSLRKENFHTHNLKNRQPGVSSVSHQEQEAAQNWKTFAAHDWEDACAQFWPAYPLQEHYGDVEAWFQTQYAREETPQQGPRLIHQMLAALAQQRTGLPRWQKAEGRYIERPAIWLQKKGWRNTVPPKPRPRVVV